MNSEDLLEALLFKVHLLTLEQIAAGWLHGANVREVRRALAPLASRHLVSTARVLAHPLLPLAKPVLRWTPADPEPDFSGVSNTLQTRWTELPKPFSIVVATPKAANQLGGVPGTVPPLGHEAHDIHLSEVYVRLLKTQPTRARAWLGEESIRASRKGQKLPDAVITDPQRGEIGVVEFGGTYDQKRLRAFHAHCHSRALPYELW